MFAKVWTRYPFFGMWRCVTGYLVPEVLWQETCGRNEHKLSPTTRFPVSSKLTTWTWETKMRVKDQEHFQDVEDESLMEIHLNSWWRRWWVAMWWSHFQKEFLIILNAEDETTLLSQNFTNQISSTAVSDLSTMDTSKWHHRYASSSELIN